MEKAKWNNLFINVALFFIVMAFICLICTIIGIFEGSINQSAGKILLLSVASIFLCVIIYELKKVVKLVMKNQVFNKKNVKSFNVISYMLYILAIVLCFINNENYGMQLIAIDNIFSIKFDSVILLVLGSFASLMSYVFDEAIKVKEESEALKEENRYTI